MQKNFEHFAFSVLLGIQFGCAPTLDRSCKWSLEPNHQPSALTTTNQSLLGDDYLEVCLVDRTNGVKDCKYKAHSDTMKKLFGKYFIKNNLSTSGSSRPVLITGVKDYCD